MRVYFWLCFQQSSPSSCLVALVLLYCLLLRFSRRYAVMRCTSCIFCLRSPLRCVNARYCCPYGLLRFCCYCAVARRDCSCFFLPLLSSTYTAHRCSGFGFLVRFCRCCALVQRSCSCCVAFLYSSRRVLEHFCALKLVF